MNRGAKPLECLHRKPARPRHGKPSGCNASLNGARARRKVSITSLVAALRSRAKLDASQCIEDRVCVGEIIDTMTDVEREAFATNGVLPKRPSVAAVIAAVRVLAKLDAGQCVEETVNMAEIVERMTDAELEVYTQDGVLPEWVRSGMEHEAAEAVDTSLQEEEA